MGAPMTETTVLTADDEGQWDVELQTGDGDARGENNNNNEIGPSFGPQVSFSFFVYM